ncbi:MAG: acyl-CoA dehydrogenase family protein [Burkholderiaceae bacterium]
MHHASGVVREFDASLPPAARELLARALAYGEVRHAFRRPALDSHGLMWLLIDVAADLEAIRLLAYRATRLIEAGEDAQWAAAVAKKFANERAVAGICACMRAMGANGLRSELPLARHPATARVLSDTDGSVEMMNERIGHLLRAV